MNAAAALAVIDRAAVRAGGPDQLARAILTWAEALERRTTEGDAA